MSYTRLDLLSPFLRRVRQVLGRRRRRPGFTPFRAADSERYQVYSVGLAGGGRYEVVPALDPESAAWAVAKELEIDFGYLAVTDRAGRERLFQVRRFGEEWSVETLTAADGHGALSC